MWLAVGKAKIKIAKIVNFDRIAKISALENIKIYSSMKVWREKGAVTHKKSVLYLPLLLQFSYY